MSLNLPAKRVILDAFTEFDLREQSEGVGANFEEIARSALSVGQAPLFPSSQGGQILAGSISAAGVSIGNTTTGWAVARTPAAPVGDYTITFTSAFANVIPVFVPLAVNNNPVVIAGGGSIRYQTFTPAGALADTAVAFIALGV